MIVCRIWLVIGCSPTERAGARGPRPGGGPERTAPDGTARTGPRGTRPTPRHRGRRDEKRGEREETTWQDSLIVDLVLYHRTTPWSIHIFATLVCVGRMARPGRQGPDGRAPAHNFSLARRGDDCNPDSRAPAHNFSLARSAARHNPSPENCAKRGENNRRAASNSKREAGYNCRDPTTGGGLLLAGTTPEPGSFRHPANVLQISVKNFIVSGSLYFLLRQAQGIDPAHQAPCG